MDEACARLRPGSLGTVAKMEQSADTHRVVELVLGTLRAHESDPAAEEGIDTDVVDAAMR